MDKINCPSREDCAAPLCPLEFHEKAQWFPDEDICHSRAINRPLWVMKQRKIQRLLLKGCIDSEMCFTIPMLEAIKAVRHPKGMRPEDLYRNGTGQVFDKPSI